MVFSSSCRSQIVPCEEAFPFDRKCRMTLLHQRYAASIFPFHRLSTLRFPQILGIVGRDHVVPVYRCVCDLKRVSEGLFFWFCFEQYKVRCHVDGSRRALTGDAMIGPKSNLFRIFDRNLWIDEIPFVHGAGFCDYTSLKIIFAFLFFPFVYSTAFSFLRRWGMPMMIAYFWVGITDWNHLDVRSTIWGLRKPFQLNLSDFC